MTLCRARIKPRSHPTGASGFTLLEVLVALAVFVISVVALHRLVSQSVSQTDYLERKVVALWIAQDTLTLLRLDGAWPAVGQSVANVRQMNQEWWVETRVSETSEPLLRRVDVRVGSGAEEATLFALHGFIGKH